ncbi:peptidoglycan-binding protein [Streptomyces sp. NPDC088090]|uniref:peptidoglycan-binding domain-containing protein n=1 Tax=Streptomyces sp. NPDC088090 TaxID=3365822 RepID=UPI00384F201D
MTPASATTRAARPSPGNIRTPVTMALAALPTWPPLQKGAAGNDVAGLQFLLRQYGGAVTAHAEFDVRTRNAVIAFQQDRGLSADGIVGPATWSRLVISVAPGSAQPDAVRALRFRLRGHGHRTVATDGVFGQATTTAVEDYKAQHRLTGGSTVGATTWQHLLGSAPGPADRPHGRHRQLHGPAPALRRLPPG